MTLKQIIQEISNNTDYDTELTEFFTMHFDAVNKLETMQNIKGITIRQHTNLRLYIDRLNKLGGDMERAIG